MKACALKTSGRLWGWSAQWRQAAQAALCLAWQHAGNGASWAQCLCAMREAAWHLGGFWAARGHEGRRDRKSLCARESDASESACLLSSILSTAAWAQRSSAAYQRTPRADGGLRRTGAAEARKKQADKAGFGILSAGRSAQVRGWKDSAQGRTRKRLPSFTLQKERDNLMKGKNCVDGKKAKESGRHKMCCI